MIFKNKKIRIIFIMVALLVIGGTVSLIFHDKIKTAVNGSKVSVENQGKPRFVFDTENFSDWATSGNVWTNPDDITDDYIGNKNDIPLSSINITQCETGSSCSSLVEKCRIGDRCEDLQKYTADGCFVHAFYFDHTLDPNTAATDRLKKWTGFNMNPRETGVKTLNMNTPEGNKEYQLYQYDTGNKDDTYKRGNAFAFVPLSDGYIEIQSICWKASQLDETLPVLDALRLESN